MADRLNLHGVNLTQNNPVVFDLDSRDPDDYRKFVQGFSIGYDDNNVLSASLYTRTEPKKFLRRLRNNSDLKYFDVEFRSEGRTVQCRFLEYNLYFIGFRPMNWPWHQLDWSERENHNIANIDDMNDDDLIQVGNDYGALSSGAVSRRNLRLTWMNLFGAVTFLSEFNSEEDVNEFELKRSLLIICQFIPEAIRFPEIRESICQSYIHDDPQPLQAQFVALENSWGVACTRFTGLAILERLEPNPMAAPEFIRVNAVLELRGVNYVEQDVPQRFMISHQHGRLLGEALRGPP